MKGPPMDLLGALKCDTRPAAQKPVARLLGADFAGYPTIQHASPVRESPGKEPVMILWNVLLLIALAVAVGLAFSIGGTWTERVILASVVCGLVVYGFYLLTGSSSFAP